MGKSGVFCVPGNALISEKKVKRAIKTTTVWMILHACGVCRQDADHQVGDTECANRMLNARRGSFASASLEAFYAQVRAQIPEKKAKRAIRMTIAWMLCLALVEYVLMAKFPMRGRAKQTANAVQVSFALASLEVCYARAHALTLDKKAKRATWMEIASAISPALVAFAGKMETTKCPMKGLASQIASALPGSFAW